LDTAEELLAWLAPQPGERVLDAGCGMGEWTARLAASGACVTGVDRLGVLLEQARWKYPKLEFVEADLMDYQPAQPFHAIYAHATLHWMRPPDRAARRMRELLVMGGRLAAALGGACETARKLDAYYAPAARQYRKVLEKAGFTVERMEERGETLMVLARMRE
jgi:trans-aconitate methyltransferase